MDKIDAARLYLCLWALLDASQEINRVACVIKETDSSIYELYDELRPEKIAAIMKILKFQANNLLTLEKNAMKFIKDIPTDPERQEEENAQISDYCNKYSNSGETIIDKMLKKLVNE